VERESAAVETSQDGEKAERGNVVDAELGPGLTSSGISWSKYLVSSSDANSGR
jgi:hypothetical protein